MDPGQFTTLAGGMAAFIAEGEARMLWMEPTR